VEVIKRTRTGGSVEEWRLCGGQEGVWWIKGCEKDWRRLCGGQEGVCKTIEVVW
jgi:hypothetical protein